MTMRRIVSRVVAWLMPDDLPIFATDPLLDGLFFGRVAYETRFANEPPRCVTPFDDLPDEARGVWTRVAEAVRAQPAQRNS